MFFFLFFFLISVIQNRSSDTPYELERLPILEMLYLENVFCTLMPFTYIFPNYLKLNPLKQNVTLG
jgi:hypothetical protein